MNRIIQIAFLGLIVFIISACNSALNTEQIENRKSIFELLQGSWKSNTFDNDWRELYFIFEFRDSLCSILHPSGDYKPYGITGDTIHLIEEDVHGYQQSPSTLAFAVDSISTDTLILHPLSQAMHLMLERYGDPDRFDRIHFSKIKPDYNHSVERIAFFSSPCYGYCPIMYLEIDQTGNFYFNGKHYTDITGLFKGKLSKKQLIHLNKSIHSIQIDSLKKKYEASWTDDQFCEILFKTNSKIYYSNVYGFKEEPAELRVLFHQLMELYKSVELTQDSSILESFEFYSEEGKYSPIIPPPPILSVDEEMEKLRKELETK